MKKQFICKTILLFLFIMFILTIKSYAESAEFTYDLDSNNYASITSYKGTSGNITIPSTIDGYEVKTIANHAFNEERNETNGKVLTNVIISEGITKIGDFSFNDCTNLESVTVPESVTDLGFQTFIGCSKLTKINIPSKVTKFQDAVFQGTGFTEFELPENIQKMDSSFHSCKNLKKVVIYNTEMSYYTSTMVYDESAPNGEMRLVDNEPFYNCSEDLVLYSYKGSTTEEYANKHGITFRDIDMLSSDTFVQSITISVGKLSLNEGASFILATTITPENATNKTIIWSSNNENVAKVEDGKVIAISEGTATITATTADGNHTDTCEVIVTKSGKAPSGTETGKEEEKKEPSTVPTEIPKAGSSTTLITLIIFTIALAIIIKANLKKYKEIK